MGCSIHSISPEFGASCGYLLGDRSKGRKSSSFPHCSRCKAPPTSAESALSCLTGSQVYPKCCSPLFSDKTNKQTKKWHQQRVSIKVLCVRFQVPLPTAYRCAQGRRCFSHLENRLQGVTQGHTALEGPDDASALIKPTSKRHTSPECEGHTPPPRVSSLHIRWIH